MKPYLFTYSQLCSDAFAQRILDETKDVSFWVQPFPHAAIITSDLGVGDLSAILHDRLGDAWFIVSELHPKTVNGLLPGNLWQFVRTPAIASPQELIPGYNTGTTARQESGRGHAA